MINETSMIHDPFGKSMGHSPQSLEPEVMELKITSMFCSVVT